MISLFNLDEAFTIRTRSTYPYVVPYWLGACDAWAKVTRVILCHADGREESYFMKVCPVCDVCKILLRYESLTKFKFPLATMDGTP